MPGLSVIRALVRLPKFTVDFKATPYAADNIWQAQMAGWERVLRYRPLTAPQGRTVRGRTMSFEYGGTRGKIPTITGADRDEYPFAATCEGSHLDVGTRTVWVGHVPLAENRSVGSLLGHFFRRNAMKPGVCFEVEVINHPQGPVIFGAAKTESSANPSNGE